ncbi:MAG: hypothetical protein JW700_00845 [Candidatus Aenigmarchaeota archaeon]|nr:hypothetical protein [Candidatus Aenigmarchaeota archaeon]
MKDDFENVFREIDDAISKNRTKGVESVEVTEYQWSVLMSNKDFERQAKRKNPNLGGYKIEKSKDDKFKVNFQFPSY